MRLAAPRRGAALVTVAALIAALPQCASAATPPVGQFGSELAAAASGAGASAKEMRGLSAQSTPAQLQAAAQRLTAAAARARDVLDRYAQAQVRDGSLSEFVALRTVQNDLLEALGRLQAAAGSPPPDASRRQRGAADNATDDFGTLARQLAAARLGISGLEDVLDRPTFRKIGRRLRSDVADYAEEQANRALRRITGVGVVLGVPLKEQIAAAGEAAAARAIGKLIVRAGPAGIAVQILFGRKLDRIISLVGRTLREALRGKGHLQRRASRSIRGLERLAAEWDALVAGGDPSVRALRRLGGQILDAIRGTAFLQHDLRRRTALLAQLQAAIEQLGQRVSGYTAIIESQPFRTSIPGTRDMAAKVESEAEAILADLGGGPLTPPTAASCVPKSITMEQYDFYGNKTGQSDQAQFSQLVDQSTYEKKCLWVYSSGTEAFVVFVNFTPPDVPGTLAAGDCDHNSDNPNASDQRYLSVSGGTRSVARHAQGGDEAVLQQTLAAAEAAGVGRACPRAPR